MTYQPKSYRKFVATAATATLVATAFAPFASAHSFKDVETKYEEAVNFLVSKGVSGYPDGTFKTQKTITRLEAAEMLGKALGLDKVTDAPASGFTDVPARVATLINAFKAKGITSGKTATTFAPNAEITRGELAVWIQKAYDLKAKEGSTNKFTDVADNYKAAVQAFVDNKIASGTSETTFGTTTSAKRGDFALFVKRAADAAVVKEVAVESVSAINSTTLEVVFNGDVKEVAAEDFVFDNDLKVLKAVIKTSESKAKVAKTTVVLTTSEQKVGTTYSLVSYKGEKPSTEIKFETPSTELVVKSVSAITANYVTVAITSADEDRLAQKVEVKDAAGNVIAVKPLDIAAGDKTAEFEFVTPVKAENLTGVWTVNGQSYDLDLFNKLSKFLSAGDQIALNKALTDLGIKNVKVENLPGYFTAKGDITKSAEELTLAEVQKLVDDVNAKSVDADTEKEIVKAVQDALTAGNQVALLSALNNDVFVRVNSKWVSTATDGYIYKIESGDNTVAKVQAKIDSSNDTILKASGTLTTTGIDKEKLTASQELIDAYATVDKDGKITDSTIKTYPGLIKTQIAVADVVSATTPTALKTKLTALATLVDNSSTLDMKDYVDANGKAYVEALKLKADTEKDTVAKIKGILFGSTTGVNDVEAGKLVKAVNDAASERTVDADKLLKALNDLGLKQVAASNKEVYKADAEAFKTNSDTGNGKTKADVQTQIDKSNVKAITTATDADKLLEALKVLDLKNVVDANKDAYLADVKKGVSATIKTDATVIDDALKVINQAETVKAEVKAINEAKTAAEVKAALDELAIDSYVNVASVDKLYIAEQVLEVRDTLTAGRSELKANGDNHDSNTVATAKTFANDTDLTGHLAKADSGIIAKYTKLVGEFAKTKLTSISVTVTQLDKLGYDTFDKLSAGMKTKVAELFMTNYPVGKDGNPATYKTLAAVKAGVDAAIAEASK